LLGLLGVEAAEAAWPQDVGGFAAGTGAEVAPTIRLDGEVTAVESAAVEVDEPTAGRAEARAVSAIGRCHASQT
jgi:hypothetical protein